MSREDSGVIDLFAICARPSSSPAGDLRPPDLFSVAPPAVTTDIDENDASSFGLFQTRSRKKLALAAAGAVLLMVGLVVVGVSGGKPQPARASATEQLPIGAALPFANVAMEVATAPPTPRAVPSVLPAPPTTGAPLIEKAPPRVASPMKARVPTASGPKMTKVKSGGVAGR